MIHLASTVGLFSECLHIRKQEESIEGFLCQKLPPSAEIDNEFCLAYSL